MKPYLVDVPVCVWIWIRPEKQRALFDIIKKAKPSVLFLISDGGRNDTEKRLIKESREVFNEIDWECQVNKLFFDDNHGMYSTMYSVMDYVWSKADRCIFLEDDYEPSVSFFQYCAELLEKYKYDERICCICGMNHLGIYDEVKDDYFFCENGSIWGTATWKRVLSPVIDYSYIEDKHIIDEIDNQCDFNPGFKKAYKGYARNEYSNGHKPGFEFILQFRATFEHQLFIIPKKNLIRNTGYGTTAAHSTDLKKLPSAIAKLYDMNTYELEFPLKHPKYIFADRKYNALRNRMTGTAHPMISMKRKIEGTFKRIMYGDGKIVVMKIIERFRRGNKIEN